MGQETVGSKACSGCHAEIYRRYSVTSMSLSSGKVGSGPFARTGSARIFRTRSARGLSCFGGAGGYRLEFSRAESGVRGQRLLGWFVGSGRVGRSYLSSLDGFLFQAPVSYYSLARKWDISPGYQQHRFIHLTRAVVPDAWNATPAAFSRSPARRTASATRPFGREASVASDAMGRERTTSPKCFRITAKVRPKSSTR